MKTFAHLLAEIEEQKQFFQNKARPYFRKPLATCPSQSHKLKRYQQHQSEFFSLNLIASFKNKPEMYFIGFNYIEDFMAVVKRPLVEKRLHFLSAWDHCASNFLADLLRWQVGIPFHDLTPSSSIYDVVGKLVRNCAICANDFNFLHPAEMEVYFTQLDIYVTYISNRGTSTIVQCLSRSDCDQLFSIKPIAAPLIKALLTKLTVADNTKEYLALSGIPLLPKNLSTILLKHKNTPSSHYAPAFYLARIAKNVDYFLDDSGLKFSFHTTSHNIYSQPLLYGPLKPGQEGYAIEHKLNVTETVLATYLNRTKTPHFNVLKILVLWFYVRDPEFVQELRAFMQSSKHPKMGTHTNPLEVVLSFRNGDLYRGVHKATRILIRVLTDALDKMLSTPQSYSNVKFASLLKCVPLPYETLVWLEDSTNAFLADQHLCYGVLPMRGISAMPKSLVAWGVIVGDTVKSNAFLYYLEHGWSECMFIALPVTNELCFVVAKNVELFNSLTRELEVNGIDKIYQKFVVKPKTS